MRDIAILRTERLLLRPFRPDDAGAVAAAVANYDVDRWLAVVPFPYGQVNAEAFVVSQEAGAGRAWAICDAGELVGAVSVNGELGYWLAREARGRGFAAEAGRAAVDPAFADLTRPVLSASHMLGNGRSARVLEELGFQSMGSGGCHFRTLGQGVAVRKMQMTRAEWRGSRSKARWSSAGRWRATA